jgi:hypothetical protein
VVEPAVELHGQLDASEDDIEEEQRATEHNELVRLPGGNSCVSKKPAELAFRS